jgi:hypothetical protein
MRVPVLRSPWAHGILPEFAVLMWGSCGDGDDQLAISVDTKKKELIGDYANGGNWYAKGVRITPAEFAAVPLHLLIPNDFHGEWNYKITAQADLT